MNDSMSSMSPVSPRKMGRPQPKRVRASEHSVFHPRAKRNGSESLHGTTQKDMFYAEDQGVNTTKLQFFQEDVSSNSKKIIKPYRAQYKEDLLEEKIVPKMKTHQKNKPSQVSSLMPGGPQSSRTNNSKAITTLNKSKKGGKNKNSKSSKKLNFKKKNKPSKQNGSKKRNSSPVRKLSPPKR